jgi:hypothetical protein
MRPGGRFTAARSAAGIALQFEQNEVGDAGAVKAPGGGEPGDAAADDDNAMLFPGIGGRSGPPAVAEPVAEHVRWTNELARRQRRHGLRTTPRCRQRGRSEKRGQQIAARRFHWPPVQPVRARDREFER